MFRTPYLSMLIAALTLSLCGLPMVASANPMINEFMADNDSTRADEDGDFSDWIEIRNPTGASINLNGWHLTDEADNLNKWRFPAVTIPAGGYVLVFASGKDRATAGSELHANFKLSASGEYLALIDPDGLTIIQEFAPEYPAQSEDISYGLGLTVTAPVTYISDGDTASAHVPVIADAGDEADWMLQGFDDSGWLSGPTGVGYEASSSQTYTNLIGLDVKAEMNTINESVWIRMPFTVTDPSAVLSLTLGMRYDDGFVAYINGTVIASANEEDTPPMPWNAGADRDHSDSEAIYFVDFDASTHVSALTAGENILAIHGLNHGLRSSDMLITPKLHGGVDPGGQVAELRYFTAPTPGTANSTGVLGMMDEVQCSSQRGFYDTPFALTLTSQVPDAQIRYTTDGTMPTSSHGSIYSSPLDITTTTVVRAAAFKSGYLDAEAVAHSFIFLDDVLD